MRQHVAALRLLLVLTVLVGAIYPAAMTAAAQLPGLKDNANGSRVTIDGVRVGSSLIGQSFLDDQGKPVRKYFQSRPSAAGDGYDLTASSASNLGPEDIVDSSDSLSLLTQVCMRSVAVGALENVDGSRPFCTSDSVGAVLAVFWSGPGYAGRVTRVLSVNQTCPAAPFITTWKGVGVTCRSDGEDIARGQIVPVRGDAPAHPVVPADAVTASGSGLDPHISVAYARLQEARVARVRGLPVAVVDALVGKHTQGRGFGFLGEPRVNVLELNIALDQAQD